MAEIWQGTASAAYPQGMRTLTGGNNYGTSNIYGTGPGTYAANTALSTMIAPSGSSGNLLNGFVNGGIQGAANTGANSVTGVLGGALSGAGGSGIDPKLDPSNYNNLSEWQRNKLQSIASGNDHFMADSFLQGLGSQYNDPGHIGATGDSWQDSINAWNNMINAGWNPGQDSSSGGGGGGGGGGAASGSSSGAGTGSSTGSNLGGLLGGADNPALSNQVGGTPNNINPFPTFPNNSPSGVFPGTGTPGTFPTGGNGSIPGSQISGGQQPLDMMQAGPGNALQNYYNTAGYQLTNGAGAVNNFQASPGYQFAVDQALGQVQRQGASRGLLDSGAGLRAMTDRAQGMANQEFNNWQQNQQAQYNQYQNRLQGLASGPVGAEQAYGLGQQTGSNAMQTGSNIGSILANQGNSLFGGIVGAGGAQAQNVTQAGNMQAQILAGNLQTQMMLAALAAGQQR